MSDKHDRLNWPNNSNGSYRPGDTNGSSRLDDLNRSSRPDGSDNPDGSGGPNGSDGPNDLNELGEPDDPYKSGGPTT
ncbi:hypothetical protein DEO72_LG2g2225 [Vigna unguiculata]|uniref:Uncharacterized protein n=1 Tax=Vigna unguiculata TaxID=3917 RepID=A0A4D6L0Z4_VIGUN|nr:hypothetical protein DEO72_LG2g2225 [Vigna unguiculata]